MRRVATPPRSLRLAHARVRLESEVGARRRDMGRVSLQAFGRLYFPHLLSKPDSVLHIDLYAYLQPTPESRGLRLAIGAPRGIAKSTVVSLMYVVWCVCYGTEAYIVLLSDTADKAADFLGQIKTELETNPRLRMDFPHVCEPVGRKPPPTRWRKNEIITRTGVKLTALGAGQKLRGRKHGAYRPTLLILDDVENEDNTATAEARERLAAWFAKVVLKSGTPETNVVVVGTLQHYDALLARLVDPNRAPAWTGRVYRSVLAWSPATDAWEHWVNLFHRRTEDADGRTGPEAAAAYLAAHEDEMLEDTAVLWPELEDYATLMVMRESEGHASFDSEKQNEPVNPRDCLFQPEDFVFWDAQWPTETALLAMLGTDVQMLGACDPSLGKRGTGGDDSAIVTVARHRSTGTLYVLDADLARRPPDRTIDDILAYHQRRRYKAFAVETNQFQVLMADELRKRANAQGSYLRVRDVTHRTDKIARIQSLQPLVKAGALQFNRRHRQLLEQLRLFPKAAHDDGPDALEMAVAVAHQHGRHRVTCREF